MNAYDIINTYCDPGVFVLPVSTQKKVLIDGKQIQYGPTRGTITKTDAGYSVSLDSAVTVEIDPGVHAKVTGFDLTQAATFALGTVGPFGIVAFRRPINLSFGDAQ